MKQITIAQWHKMPDRSKDWLIVKTLGFFVEVFWHVDVNGVYSSGSYHTESHARAVLNYKPNKYPKNARVARSLCYWCVTTVPNCANSVVEEMLKRGWRCTLDFNPPHLPDGFKTACFYQNPDKRFWFDDASMEKAICAAALQAMGQMQLYPF